MKSMSTTKFSFLLLFISLTLTGQQSVEESAEVSRWAYDAFSYPDFGTGEQHSNFYLLYKLNPKLKAELQGFYDSYRIADVFDVSFRVRWYPKKKVYLFSGFGTQIERSKVEGGLPIMPLYMTGGVGFEASKNIDIEAIYDLNLSENGGLPSVFRVRGKYRF